MKKTILIFILIATIFRSLRHYLKQLSCFGVFLLFTTLTVAQINTWEGDMSDDWNTDENWSLGTVPSPSNSVIIGNGNPNDPVVKNQTLALCRTLTMSNTANLTIDDGGDLTIDGNNQGNTDGLVMLSSGMLTVNGTLRIIEHNGFGIDLSSGTLIVGALGELTITDTTNDGIDIFNNTNNHQINGELTIERTRDGISLSSNGTNITLGETSNVTLNDIEFDAIFLDAANTSCTISGMVVIDGAGQDGLDIEGNGTLEITSTGDVSLDNIDVDAVYLNSNNSTFIVGGKLTILGADEDGIDVSGGQTSVEASGQVSITNVMNSGINGRNNSFENEGFISVNQCGGFEIRGSFNNLSTGTVQVDGSVVANPFTFSSGSTLAPGSSPGCVVFNNNEDFSGVNINLEIEGTSSCAEYDQVTVEGTVILTNAILNLAGSYAPMDGETFVLIDNDGTGDLVTGTFTGLSEGATIVFNNAELEISYMGGDGNDVVLTVITVLPVELLSFKAIPKNEAILLEWTTASEINNDHFVLEKSTDGKQFLPITKIQGAGTTLTQQKYEFLDQSPWKGTNYYRLKQIDLNGTFEYSEISVVDWKEKEMIDFQFFPSPAQNHVIIQTTEQGYLQIFDHVGKIVLEQSINDSQILDISDFPPGLYFLRMNGRNKTLVVE